MKVLVTSGGTQETIDGVRFITNFSTGRTAATIASILSQNGVDVTYIAAKSAVQPTIPASRVISFVTFDDLAEILRQECKTQKFDAVIHAAAVSDFKIESIESQGRFSAPSADLKLPSDQPISLKLVPNYKILERLRDWVGSEAYLIGFKLTRSHDTDARNDKVKQLFERSHVDYLVQNDLSEIDEVASRHHCFIWKSGKPQSVVRETWTKDELAQCLYSIIKERP